MSVCLERAAPVWIAARASNTSIQYSHSHTLTLTPFTPSHWHCDSPFHFLDLYLTNSKLRNKIKPEREYFGTLLHSELFGLISIHMYLPYSWKVMGSNPVRGKLDSLKITNDHIVMCYGIIYAIRPKVCGHPTVTPRYGRFPNCCHKVHFEWPRIKYWLQPTITYTWTSFKIRMNHSFTPSTRVSCSLFNGN